MQTISIGKLQFTVPKGFKHVKWQYLKADDVVYMVGTNNGEPCSYGPFKVVDCQMRKLLNMKNNRTFIEYPESLVIKEDTKND